MSPARGAQDNGVSIGECLGARSDDGQLRGVLVPAVEGVRLCADLTHADRTLSPAIPSEQGLAYRGRRGTRRLLGMLAGAGVFATE